MAYGTAKKNNRVMLPISGGLYQTDDFPFGIWSSGDNGQDGSTETRGGAKSAGVRLMVGSPDGNYDCRSMKTYTEKASIVQELSTSDGFITLSKFAKNPAALTVNDAKVIVIKNVSNITAEIAIALYDWREDSDGTDTDVHNSVDMNEENSTGEETAVRMISALLPAGEFMYLPNSRFLSYSPLTLSDADTTMESAANADAGAVAIEPKSINSGNEYVDIHGFSGSTYFSGADIQINDGSGVAIGDTSITVDDGDWFKVGDLIMVGTEVMQVEARSGADLTVKRGLLGSTEAAHADDADLRFFFGNENLAFDNGKCQTDQNGNFSQKGGFFGYGRTADRKIDGVVAGSVAIGEFYINGGHLDWGLQNVKASDNTGLAVSTTYTFHIVVDEYNVGGIDSVSTETAIAFTTDASDVTFNGSGNAVLPKIQARFDALFYDSSSGLFNKKVTIRLHNGDIRVQSHSNHSDTRVGIANVSGTTPFGVGRFPALSSAVPVLLGSPHGGGTTDTIVFGPASTKELAEVDDPVSGKTMQNTSAYILDDGNGNLMHNGTIVGQISYNTGHCEFTAPYPNAEFKVYAETLSAHAGGVKHLAAAYNSIAAIKGRSVNAVKDSKVEVLLLG
tara:strand:+ start:479 stop:2335 length:1857 start_codon:yes stop_codon:yes gene_type:complete